MPERVAMKLTGRKTSPCTDATPSLTTAICAWRSKDWTHESYNVEMTANAIVMKLNAILVAPVDSECKVVYVLCEVRKLMEQRIPKQARPFALNMYCHWALHVELHGQDTIAPFLRQIDAYVDGVLVGHEDFAATDRIVRDFALLDTFRSELRGFLHDNGIRREFTENDALWHEFVKHYAGVIEDGSLSFREPNGLKHVKEVTFVKGRDAMAGSTLPFDMRWSVALLNGRSLDIDVNARPAQHSPGPLFGWSVHLN
jgi:hypothetical protein